MGTVAGLTSWVCKDAAGSPESWSPLMPLRVVYEIRALPAPLGGAACSFAFPKLSDQAGCTARFTGAEGPWAEEGIRIVLFCLQNILILSLRRKFSSKGKQRPY